MNEIAVLITCHNRRAKTLACLAALYACELPAGYTLDVFLVDDGCTDGTGDAVRLNYPEVNVIQGDGNLYWNRGMHLAWKTASEKRKYDYFLWLNDDVLLFKNTISELMNASVTLGDKAIVAGQTISENSKTVTYGGRMMAEGGNLLTPNGELQKCDYCNGNLVLIPHYVYRKIGTNDAIFHHSGGDDDYSLRAKKLDIDTYIIGNAVGYCEHNDHIPVWCNEKQPLVKRIKNLYSPLSYSHPREHWIFDMRHRGLNYAITHQIKIFSRLFFPALWKLKKI